MGKSLLLIEDDPDVKDAIQEVLEQEGYAVASASHGEEAIAYLSTRPPVDLIILDFQMPRMDGLGFFRRTRSDPWLKAIPILVITAGRSWAEVPDGVRVLYKPFELQALLSTVEEYFAE